MFPALLAAIALTVPPGFREAPQFEPAASFVAAKPVHVYCALTAAVINATVGANASDVQGATPVIGGNVIYLSPLTCAFLNAWRNGKKPKNLYGVAGSLQTLAHESEHAKGIPDETDADCASLKWMVPMTRKFFPLRKRITMHNLMAIAWEMHYAKAPEYREHPC